WSEKVRRSVLLDAKADILLYGNSERALVELAWRLADGEPVAEITDLRGTAFTRREIPGDFAVLDSSTVDTPGRLEPRPSPYEDTSAAATSPCAEGAPSEAAPLSPPPPRDVI